MSTMSTLCKTHLACRPSRCHAPRAVSCTSRAAIPITNPFSPTESAVKLYEDVWSEGRIRLLDQIMAEDHEQRDMVWQPQRVGRDPEGRRRLKRGVLAYRAAYPDIRFMIHLLACPCPDSQPPSAASGSTSKALQQHHDHGHHQAHQGAGRHTISNGAHEATHSAQQATYQQQQQQQQQPPHAVVMVHWSAEGRNLGPIRDSPPTGRTVRFSGITRLDFNAHGQIATSHVYRQAPADEAEHFIAAGQAPWAAATAQAAEPASVASI